MRGVKVMKDKIPVSCKHGNHVDIIEQEWEGKILLLSFCQDCKDELKEILDT